MIALLASLFLATVVEPVIPTNATPVELVQGCRRMLPRSVELTGRIILRNRKGLSQAEYAYDLMRKDGETTLKLTDDSGADVPFEKTGPIAGTDVTWSDLTLDYLNWPQITFDAEREGETVNGQTCAVVLLSKEGRTVRAWIDRKYGALMQAEELKEGEAMRRLWGTRIKKFGSRWMANVLEVETLGSGHRTKITVEEMK